MPLYTIESAAAGLCFFRHMRRGFRRFFKVAFARILLERCIFVRHAATLRALPPPRF